MTSGPPRWLLSGGIGSGKSTVRKLLEKVGLRTIDADSVGHRVLQEEAIEEVSARWPGVVDDGTIDRSALAAIVFSDADALRELESITHPLIFGRITADLDGYMAPAIVEVPLLESVLGWPRLVVDADDGLRSERLLARGETEEDVARRIAAQPSRRQWLASADAVIPNHGSREELEATVAKLAGHLVGDD